MPRAKKTPAHLLPPPALPPAADPYSQEARDEAFRSVYGPTPEDKAMARKKARTARPLPQSFNDLVLTRGSELLTPDGILHLEKIGKGMFSTIYRETGGERRVFAMTVDGAYEKEILATAHEEYPENPHLPALEKFGILTDDRMVYVMKHYTAPYRVANANEEDAKAFLTIRKCVHEPAAFHAIHRMSGYEGSHHRIDCMRAAGLPEPLLEAITAIVEASSNYGDSFTMEFSPRNVATDEHGRLVLLDLLYDRELVDKLKAKRGWNNNPLPTKPPKVASKTRAKGKSRPLPGQREMVGIFLFEPLRSYVYDYWLARVPVFGAEIEAEGDHYRLRPAKEEETMRRLAAEDELRGRPPERVVVFGLYDRLSREEAGQAVSRLVSAKPLHRSLGLVVAHLTHDVEVDRLKLKAAGLPTTATLDEVLAADMGASVTVKRARFDVRTVPATPERLCEEIEAQTTATSAVLEVVPAPSRADAEAVGQQKAKELYSVLRYRALASECLRQVQIKATRWTDYRPWMCTPSWS